MQSLAKGKVREETLSAAKENVEEVQDEKPSGLMIHKSEVEKNNTRAKVMAGPHLCQGKNVLRNGTESCGKNS